MVTLDATVGPLLEKYESFARSITQVTRALLAAVSNWLTFCAVFFLSPSKLILAPTRLSCELQTPVLSFPTSFLLPE